MWQNQMLQREPSIFLLLFVCEGISVMTSGKTASTIVFDKPLSKTY